MKNDLFVIFDMDGVIFDSERAYINAFRDICEQDGVPFIEEACIECIGANWNKTKLIYEKWYGEDWDFPYYYDKVREVLGKLVFPLKPGVFELLDCLKNDHSKIALASSTREVTVRRMLSYADLLKYFDVVICGDMVSHSKPHPEIFLTAAERLGAEPSKCFVIEDSYNGIRCAHNAGMRPIMVPDILQPDEEIKSLAEVVLPTLNEVIPYIKENI